MKSHNKIPEFKSENEERDFWVKEDSTEFIDWEKAKSASFPNLKKSLKGFTMDSPKIPVTNPQSRK